MLELTLSSSFRTRNLSLSASDESDHYRIETPCKWGFKTLTAEVTRWKGAKHELVATIEWTWIGLPRAHFVHEIVQDVFLKRGRCRFVTEWSLKVFLILSNL